MKRSVVTTLIIGVAVAIVVGLLHARRLIPRLELVSHSANATRVVGEKWQYIFVSLLALGVAWLSLSSLSRNRTRLLVVVLLIELVGLSWVCSLYRVFFQPLPSIFAVVLAWIAAESWTVFLRRDRGPDLVQIFFANHLSEKEFRRLSDDAIRFDAQPRTYEVSVMACDIADKYEFARESEPAAFAETMGKFVRDMPTRLLETGAYLHAADGEGVVAIFGFPATNSADAERTVRIALDLVEDFRKKRQNDGKTVGNCDVHVGISFGTIIAAPLKDSGSPVLLISGEPIELARRFCGANHLYGSKILIDTRTFDLANKAIVARPIDFLKGLNSEDRHEIYEPLWLAAEAKPEHIARRDSFWSGVVLYREKRWAEAYTEFQKARGSDGEEDPPLQFYLRRLAPLALHLTDIPPD
jgi:class 3 adenylate cyclase